MRTIKFRGKRLDNGEWLYGDLMHVNEQVLINPVLDEPYQYAEDFDANVDPKTVGQFLDLTDLRGREIYEGDVAQGENGKRYWFKWGVNSNGFIARTNEPHCNVYSSYHLAPKVEVIGNIHDHPHLLEVPNGS